MKALLYNPNLVAAVAVLAVLCTSPWRNGPAHSGPAHAWRPVARFVGDFERGDLSQWSHREGARADSIQVVTDPVRAGRYAAKFTVRHGERVSNGNRSELTWDNRDWPTSDGWYAWSFLIPHDFVDVEWKPKVWQCLGQWHDQPDKERGETWAKFPGHSPSIAIYYHSRKGVPGIELWYGPLKDQKIIATAPIQKGRWMDLVFHIGWSPGEDGFIAAWLNGKPLTPPKGNHHKVLGANMWNAYPHFLKVGIYRSSDITTTSSVYFDEVRIGNSYEEVAPARGDRRGAKR